eukprot:g14293.t1
MLQDENNDPHTAVIELATASGLELLSPDERNPMRTSTFGTGRIIDDAIDKGAKHILLGIGGSATNDAGVGIAAALDVFFMNGKGKLIGKTGYDATILSQIAEVLPESRLLEEGVSLTVACDVNNQLTGPNGAAHVYAPQKGATPEQVEELDAGLRHMAQLWRDQLGVDVEQLPGAGAAGGVGGGLVAMLGAELVPGAELVLDTIGFDERIKDADLVITGEGRLDRQSLQGKAAMAVAKRCQKTGVPCIALVGSVGEGAEDALDHGLSAYHVIGEGLAPEESIRRTSDAEEDANAPKLVIHTPHNEQIRFEIEHAFNDWRIANELPPVVFDWRTVGGTGDIRKNIISQFTQLVRDDKDLDRGIGADLFFGGGDYDHGKVANGIKVGEASWSPDNYRIVDDPQIDPALFEAALGDGTIGGEPLFTKRGFNEAGSTKEVIAWTGITLSSFGIVYNKDSLRHLNIDAPETWSDLGDPRLRGWVALADPGHSGSISKTFETILKREGWTEGWVTLRNAFANARYFATSADRVPVDVSRGDAAVGMCIDFYGRFQTGKVGDDRMGYSDPVEAGQSMTATTADPITLLRGAPSPELAREFIAWLLTKDAQSLWQRSLSDGSDDLVRPKQFELRRQPLRADLYTDASRASWVDQELNPYPTAVPFPEGTPSYFSMVAPLTKAMASEVHGDMVAAWRALNDALQAGHPDAQQMRELFYAMPPELTLAWPDAELEANWLAIQRDADHPRHSEVVDHLGAFKNQLRAIEDVEASRIQWRSFFQDNYREVVRLAGE